jgi:predicted acetyltransferase
VQFYQRAGFERAGLRMSYRLPLDAIRCREHTLDVVRVAPGNYGEVYRAYEQRARQSAGNLERPAWMWQRRLEPEAQPIFRYLVQREGQTEGYVVFTQGKHSDPLSIQDVCVLTPQAGRRVLTLLAGYRSIVEHMTWYGGPCDPLLALFGEPLLAGIQQRAEVLLARDWMLRLVDVAAALAARGYPPGLQGELHLDVVDEVLPANNGRCVLRVAGGRGAVLPGGAGRVRLGVRELAAIYSGHMAPADLRFSGQIEGPASDMALLGALFAGPRPWVADMF